METAYANICGSDNANQLHWRSERGNLLNSETVVIQLDTSEQHYSPDSSSWSYNTSALYKPQTVPMICMAAMLQELQMRIEKILSSYTMSVQWTKLSPESFHNYLYVLFRKSAMLGWENKQSHRNTFSHMTYLERTFSSIAHAILDNYKVDQSESVCSQWLQDNSLLTMVCKSRKQLHSLLYSWYRVDQSQSVWDIGIST